MRIPWLTIPALASIVLLGCAATSPPIGRLTVMAPDTPSSHVTVLAPGVWGKACKTFTIFDDFKFSSWRPLGSANYAHAIEMAIRQEPEANALVDVKLYSANEVYFLWRKECAIAEGNAARVE